MGNYRRSCYFLFSFLFLTGIFCRSYAQTVSETDSLEALLTYEIPDTGYIDIAIQLLSIYEFSHPQKGIETGEPALEKARNLPDSARMARLLSRLGACYMHTGDLGRAEKLFRENLNLEIIRGKPIGMGNQYNNLGSIFSYRGFPDSAILYYEKGLALYQQEQDPVYEAIGFNNLAIVYEKQGNYFKAVDLYLKALGQFEAGKHTYGIGAVNLNLANIFTQLKDFPEALTYLRKALEVKKGMNDIQGISMVYNNMGGVFDRMEKKDSSLIYHRKSLEIKEQINDRVGIAKSYLNIGMIYFSKGNYQEAMRLYQDSYDISRETGAEAGIAHAAVSLGKAYFKLDDYPKAESYLLEGMKVATRIDEKEHILSSYKSLSELYNARKDPRAFEYYRKYAALNDTLRNDAQTKEINRLELQYQFEKEKEVMAVEQQQKEAILNGELGRQKLIRNVSFILLGAGIVILLLLLRGYRQKQKSNQLLEAQKQTIEAALEEREILLKEIHHRVKNNLQVISSLLSLQSRTIQDPHALEAIEEGRNRVKAMALIHQNLYQKENLVGVNLPDYIEQLTDSLVRSYQVNTEKIHIHRSIASVSLDVDTLIPLGLILNELIANALKYAFIDREEGNIDVNIHPREEGLEILVRDDGVGIPENFQAEKQGSLGFKLIHSFVNKMKARMEIMTQAGTSISIVLPNA